MSGLSAKKVADLILGLKLAVGDAKKARAFDVADELSDVVRVIERLQKESSDQPSRPDRIGDECWYGTWVTGKGWSWRRGILRAWVPGDCPAVVEDVETKKVDCYSMIAFSTEAPA